MRIRSDKARELFNFLMIDASEMSAHPGALKAILDKQLDGMIVRNVFAKSTIDGVVKRLQTDSVDRRVFPMFRNIDDAPYTVGQAIVSTELDLKDYFKDAAAQLTRLAALFAGHENFQERVEHVFATLSGGLPVSTPLGPSGQPYTPSTVRVLTEGHEIGVHVGNGFARLPQAQHLSTMIDMTDQISFFVPLSVPEAGGELVVYGLEYSDVAALIPTNTSAEVSNVWLEGTAIADIFHGMDSSAFTPQPGDMLIFDGGRYFHRVSKIQGKSPRRTIGGFCGFSSNHDQIYYWS